MRWPMRPQPEDSPFDRMSESNYLRRLTAEQTPVAVHLRTGEIFYGYIEYYDERFIRLTRRDASNLFIFKHDIKYLYENQPSDVAPPQP